MGMFDSVMRFWPKNKVESQASVMNFMHGDHDANFKGTTASPGQSIQLLVENRSDAERVFAGNLEGEAIL